MYIIDYRLKDYLIEQAISVLINNFGYEGEHIQRFEYSFHVCFQDYLKEMRENQKGLWDGILCEIIEDPEKRSYFTGMLCGHQIVKTLHYSLEFNGQELELFEQIFVKRVKTPNEQTHEREKN
jgi:hypothetical protein